MKSLIPILLIAIHGFPLPESSTQANADLPVEVAADNANIRYVGRFDTRDPAGPRCAWPHSSVTIRFKGTGLGVKYAASSNDWWQIVVDGKPTELFKPGQSPGIFKAATGLADAEHTVQLIRRTEAFVGTSQFRGFQLSEGGTLLPAPAAKRKIEVIGDSISCGYGNEGKNQQEHFSPTTENAYMTYGAIAARELGAEYACFAWSGRKMWSDNTIPEIYDRSLPTDPQSKWDFTRWQPDVVLVNLATNDFGKLIPDEKGWTKAYGAFLARVRKNYPEAEIYVASGSMMGDWGAGKPLTTLKRYLARIVEDRKAAGDTRVHQIDFAQQEQKDGLGSDWHPSVKTHEIMAKKLVGTLRKDMNWRD